MLGLQETRPAGTASTKTYSCVACAATFHGLSSLLVHQASHANEINNQPVATLPTCSHCGGLFASKELLEKHHCMVLPPPVSQDVYICDCGEKFQEISTFRDHKKSHDLEAQVKLQSDESATEITNKNKEAEHEVNTDYNKDSQVEVPSCLNSPSHSAEESLYLQKTCIFPEEEKKECVTSLDMPPVHSTSSEDQHYEAMESSVCTSPFGEDTHESENLNLDDVNRCHSDTEESPQKSHESVARDKKTLLKILASAYMSQRQAAQVKWGQSKRSLPPRKVSPRAPMQASTAVTASNSGCSDSQLRLKVAKYGPNRKGFMPTGSVLDLKLNNLPKKGSIVSVTKTLCPVVMLETRQKLCKDNVEGRHQCGLCRRVFQDKDSLIMHHVLHRKERVKFCRRCKQLVISVISVPDNHICSASLAVTPKYFPFVRKSILVSNDPAVQHPRKLFNCLLCNRSYTRRHNLNKHNCHWIASLKSSATANQKDPTDGSFGEGHNAGEDVVTVGQKPQSQVNVGVNTGDLLKHIKKEDLNLESPMEEKRPHLGLAKNFPPFLPKSIALQHTENASSDEPVASRAVVGQGSETVASKSVEAGQWTVPLDDAEIDVLVDADLDEAPRENSDEDVVLLEPSLGSEANAVMSGKDFQIHISESGVRRFVCNRCQKSYSRRFTLNKHLKICGARKLMVHHSFGKMSTNTLNPKKKFPCPLCGTAFTRKDNMNIHRKRCQSMRHTNPAEGDKQSQGSQENIFVLPPLPKNQTRQENNKNVGGGNWGIMSLPSVLPRKVTCECGAAFTCPRLLFEHLQMHALESYICSHCGENLQSWADFEAHQQIHIQPTRQQSEQQSEQQQSQQQQLYVQPQLQQKTLFQSAEQKQPQDLLKLRLNYKPLKEPSVCHKCKKVFTGRKSMLRHLRLSCRGDIGVPKNQTCSRCGMTFQNSLAYKVHIQANSCTPSFKPVRCPVCVRWFSCLEGLKRHLVVHSQQKAVVCQICRHNFPNFQALDEHKKSVHGTQSPSESTAQSAHVVQSSQSVAFRCQICHRNYPRMQSLKDHLRKVHRPKGPKPVPDVFAAKAEALQASFGAVQQSLSKQYQCHICGHAFPDISSLRNHRRQAHPIIGGGLQASKGTGEQSHFSRFQCQVCSRSYLNVRSLRNHRRRVHRLFGPLDTPKGVIQQSQDNFYKCQICQRNYPDAESLRTHKKRMHRIFGATFESTKLATTDIPQSVSESQSGVFHVTAKSEDIETITITP